MHQPGSGALRHVLAAVGCALLGVILTWPLATHLTTHIPGSSAHDNLTFLWSFWWVREVLSGDAAALFQTPAMFHPFGAGLAMHTHAFSSAFVGATLLSGVSIVTAQNVVIMGSVALNGLCTYGLAWRLTRSAPASILAGLYFAAAPYFSGHLVGHFNLVPAWMLPLFALTWLHALDRSSVVWAAASGAVLAFTIWTDYYYAAYLVAFIVVTLATRWIDGNWNRRTPVASTWLDWLLIGLCSVLLATVVSIRVTGGGVFFVSGMRVSATSGLPPLTVTWALLLIWLWRRWRPVPTIRFASNSRPLADMGLGTVVAVVSAAFAFPILAEAMRLWRSGAYVTPPGFLRSAAGGVDPISLIAGNPFHSLWGSLSTAVYAAASISAVESVAWFGVAGLAVCVWAFRRRGGQDWALPVGAGTWRVVGVVFFVWSLGPYLRVLGENTGLYLPAALLRLLPIANNLRIPGRAAVMVYLSIAVLLALAVAASPALRRRPWLMIVGALIIFLDFVALPLPLFQLARPVVYEELAARPAGAVLELPMGIRDGFGEHGALDHRMLFYQSIHGKPLVGGFVARMPKAIEQGYLESPLFGPLLALSAGGAVEVIQPSVEHLRGAGIRYVVLATQSPESLRSVVAQWPLRLIASDKDRQVFEVQ